MEVVIDTNAIVGDYWLRSKRWQLLLTRSENGLIGLNVPEVVVAEATKRFGEDVQAAALSLTRASREAERLVPSLGLGDAVDVENEVAGYADHLRDTLANAGASFDYPTVDPAELADMAVFRKKPFKLDGSGYPDAIVWLRARELANGDDVALISDNYKDFGGTKQGGLHPDLEAQVQAIGAGQLVRYPSPSDFHREALDHAELYDVVIRDLLRDPDVTAGLQNELLGLLDEREARAAGAWGSVAGPEDTFFTSGQVTALELVEVTDAAPDYGYAAFNAEAEAEYEFPVLYSEAWDSVEDGELGTVDIDDPDEIIGTASRTVHLLLQVDARYEPGNATLSDFELTAAQEVTPAG